VSEELHLFFAVEEPSVQVAEAVEAFVAGLNAERQRCGGSPAFIDDVDEDSATDPGDAPIWTLGGVLALTGPSDNLDAERAQLEDVEFLVEQLADFSLSGYAFEIEYGGELIGSVAAGEVGSIMEGLIEPWRERLQAG